MTKVTKLIVFACLLAGTIEPAVHAQVPTLSFVSQQRSVVYTRTVTNSGGGVDFTNRVLESSNSLGLFSAIIEGDDFQTSTIDPLDPSAPSSPPIITPGLSPAASLVSSFFNQQIQATGFQAGGRAVAQTDFFGFGGADIDEGFSAIDVVFDLSGPTEFSFEGSVTDGSSILLLSPDFSIFVFDQPVVESGILPAGQYSLTAQTAGDGFLGGGIGGDQFFLSGDSSFDFHLSLDVVPEPSSLPFVIGIGTCGLLGRRRKTFHS